MGENAQSREMVPGGSGRRGHFILAKFLQPLLCHSTAVGDGELRDGEVGDGGEVAQ